MVSATQHADPWCNVEAAMMFTMPVGLTLYEAGYVPARNTKNVILKSLVSILTATIVWYIVGFAFAFGSRGNAFIGNGNFTDINFEASQCSFATSCVVCQLASTLFHGSLAERTQPSAYAVLSLSMSAMIHPLPVHWLQDSSGWLHKGEATRGRGALDMSGACSVHLVAGAMGLSGAIMLGPRMGRFSRTAATTRRFDSMKNPSVAMMGLLMLWIGWMLWASQSSGKETVQGRTLNARAFTCCLLASAAASLTGLAISYYRQRRFSLDSMSKALLAGMVSVSASAPVIAPHFAIGPRGTGCDEGLAVAGLVGGALVEGSRLLLLHLHIDDPLDVASVHGVVGIWGIIVPVAQAVTGKGAGLVASAEYVDAYRQLALPDVPPEEVTGGGGVVLGSDGWLLCAQMLAGSVTLVWGGGIGVVTLLVLHRADLLRVEMDVEVAGCDLAFHDGLPFIERSPAGPAVDEEQQDNGMRAQVESQPVSNSLLLPGNANGGFNSAGAQSDLPAISESATSNENQDSNKDSGREEGRT